MALFLLSFLLPLFPVCVNQTNKSPQTVINKEGDNKFVQTQFGDKEVKIVREFQGDEVVVVSVC